MSGISKYSDNNYGGISRLYFALQRNIDQFFDFDYERGSLSISQANFNSNFSQLRYLHRSSNFDFQKNPDPSGAIYPNSIEATFIKNRQEILDHLAETEESKVCLVFKTNNGDWMILPYAEEAADSRGGKQPSDRNGVTITWNAPLSYPGQPVTIT